MKMVLALFLEHHRFGVVIMSDAEESNNQTRSILTVKAMDVNRPTTLVFKRFNSESDSLRLRSFEEIR